MIAILQTRILHWKKQWLSLLFWLLLPMTLTVAIIMTVNAIQEDSKIPIGLVMEDDSDLAEEFYASLVESPLIRVIKLSEAEAKNQVEKQQLDSAFIIRDGYADKIEKGNRNQLITSYKSDLSFTYTPVSEMIISYIQQDVGRSKAAHTVINFNQQFHHMKNWTWDEIITTSKDIQANANLLRTTFSFSSTNGTSNEQEISLWNPWGLWAVFSVLATFLLFDWIIKEKNSNILPRFAFIRFSFISYQLHNVLWYTILLFIMDIITAGVFYYSFNESFSAMLIVTLLSFRLTLNVAAWLCALICSRLSMFYSLSFIFTIGIAIISGAIIPIDGMLNYAPWIEWMNPITPFLEQEIFNPWLIIIGIILTFLLFRKEKLDA